MPPTRSTTNFTGSNPLITEDCQDIIRFINERSAADAKAGKETGSISIHGAAAGAAVSTGEGVPAGAGAPAGAGVPAGPTILGELDPTNLASILSHLVPALYYLCTKVAQLESAIGEKGWETVGGSVGEEIKRKEKELQARLQLQEDQLDELKQRYRKGNIIISSPDIPGKKIKSLIRKEDDLRRNNISLIEHVSSLIQTKYGVQIREEELVACHRLQNSTSVLLKFGIRTENSGVNWSKRSNPSPDPTSTCLPTSSSQPGDQSSCSKSSS